MNIKPGTCRITATLSLEGAQCVPLLGHDPADTRILYAGVPGNAMLCLNGVGHSRFGQLTCDGGRRAAPVYLGVSVPPAADFPTSLRPEHQVFQKLQGDGMQADLEATAVGTAD